MYIDALLVTMGVLTALALVAIPLTLGYIALEYLSLLGNIKPGQARKMLEKMEQAGDYANAAILMGFIHHHEQHGKWPRGMHRRVKVSKKQSHRVTPDGYMEIETKYYISWRAGK